MARIRTIKPDFFRHSDLFDAEIKSGFPIRIAFAGLWTCCDREGRFKWRPRELKLDILPHDPIDFSKVLDAMEASGFIVRYSANNEDFGYIPTWKKHQVINIREAQSTIPNPFGEDAHVHARAKECFEVQASQSENMPKELRATVIVRDGKCLRCFSLEDLTIDHIFPQSIGGTNAITNLRTLCRSCNSARPVQGKELIDDLAKDGFSLEDMQRTCMHVHARAEGKGKERKGREGDRSPSAPVIGKKKLIPLPTDFSLTDEMKAWATEQGFNRLDERLEHFRDWAKAGNKRYVDWSATFRNALRGDWAHLNKSNGSANSAEAWQAEADRNIELALRIS